MSKKVAVVILNFNTREFLEKVLPSVCKTSYPNTEIIIADNASSDDSVQFVKDNYPLVKIILLEKNYGFTGGYNRALKQVNADYYVLLNSDVEVDPNWIEPMVNLMESNPSIAAIQPKLLALQQNDTFEYAGASGGYIDRYGFPFCRGRIFDHLEKNKILIGIVTGASRERIIGTLEKNLLDKTSILITSNDVIDVIKKNYN